MHKILVVDDDLDLRRGLGIRLEGSGYEVAFASDGVSAVSKARREQPSVILLDIGLPGGDGLSVLGRLKSIMPLSSIPVIVMTAWDPSITRDRALSAGAEAFFEKPADNAMLLSTIQELIELHSNQECEEEEVAEKTAPKVLVVDDDQDLLRALNIRLKASGYNVVLATDAVSAIGTTHKESPDLIVLDIGMPGGDGFIVMERLKTRMPDNPIPVIILSARDPSANEDRAINCGAKVFLQKPVDNDELLDCIQKYLAESQESKQPKEGSFPAKRWISIDKPAKARSRR